MIGAIGFGVFGIWPFAYLAMYLFLPRWRWFLFASDDRQRYYAMAAGAVLTACLMGAWKVLPSGLE